MPVERTLTCPPRCRIGAVTPEGRAAVRARSPVGSKYDLSVNRESAYEILSRRTIEKEAADSNWTQAQLEKPLARGSIFGDLLWGTKRRQGMVQTMAKQAARTIGSQIGRQIFAVCVMVY